MTVPNNSAAFQGGFIPDNVLYLSYWYNKYDLPIRLAIFYTINPFTDIVTSFLGAGLLQMRGVLGYAGWRWMFLLEGLFTLIIGVASFWMMPTAPSKTKTKFRPNGYITDNEAKIIVNRVIRDEPTKVSRGRNNWAILIFRETCTIDSRSRSRWLAKAAWIGICGPYTSLVYSCGFPSHLYLIISSSLLDSLDSQRSKPTSSPYHMVYCRSSTSFSSP